MTARLVPNLDEATYHAATDSLSASGAKVLLGKRPPAESDALSFGTLVHVAILEPVRLSEYAALDPAKIGVLKNGEPAKNPTSTKAWEEAVAEVEEQGFTVVTAADFERAEAMAKAVLAHPTARRIIDQATDRELSAYADHPTGALVRARYDLAGPIIGDVKTTRDADPRKFGKTAHDFGYHISAANYADIAEACGMEPVGFAFINVEKEPTPGGVHRVSVTELSESAIDLGRHLMAEACRRWLANDRQIELPIYGDGFSTVDLPPYAYNDFALIATEDNAA